ncbi:hypothetical protein VNO77_33213 [Canavalia gladiata]|uniref:Uncharacterized protein n=1 Tax=Canavalia gladiata TaxID=3824 RepID=A0AAN9KDC8_CANGL
MLIILSSVVNFVSFVVFTLVCYLSSNNINCHSFSSLGVAFKTWASVNMEMEGSGSRGNQIGIYFPFLF